MEDDDMRITQGMLSSQMLYDIQGNNQRLSNLQNEAATGHRINNPSDDPIGTGFVIQYKNQSAYDQQFMNNAQTAQGVLNYTDSVMNEAGQVMQRARDLAVQGSSGTLAAGDRQAIAAEVGQLYQQLVTVGNSQYNDQYIFNGQMTSQAPYSSSAAEITTTDNGQVMYDLGNGVNLPVNIPGNQFFGSSSDSDNAFNVLKQLQTALNNNDQSTIGNLIGQIDSRTNTMLGSQSQVGALTDRAQLMQNRMSDLSQTVTGLLSNVQDADLAKVITDLNTAQTVQTASLEVGAKVIQPSLLDFLK
jgi:flagellar hook-associated protein 3 FlgL